MTIWTLAVLAMLPAFAIPVAAGLRGGTANRLAAFQVATSIATFLLALMTFALDEASFTDLALCLALLSLPGTLLLAHTLERWL